MAPNRPSRGRTGACGPIEMNPNNPLLVVFHRYFVCFVTGIFPIFFVSSVRAFFYLIYLNSARFNSTFLLSKKRHQIDSVGSWGPANGRSAGRPADKQTATLETPEIKAISRKNVDFLKPPKSEPVKGKWPKCANAFFYTMILNKRAATRRNNWNVSGPCSYFCGHIFYC